MEFGKLSVIVTGTIRMYMSYVDSWGSQQQVLCKHYMTLCFINVIMDASRCGTIYEFILWEAQISVRAIF